LEDQSICVDPSQVKGVNKDKTEPCLGPKRGKTFLNVYNCEYIRSPKPERFARAMKQIYRTSYVLSHFVHYSTVTADLAQTYSEYYYTHDYATNDTKNNAAAPLPYMRNLNERAGQLRSPELFMNELTEGALVHARSVLPHETRRRSAECYYGSKSGCMVGYLCDDSVAFIDVLHKNNSFQNPDGKYCNCWRNPVVDEILVPLLETRIKEASSTSTV
jgi:hypothetical protein